MGQSGCRLFRVRAGVCIEGIYGRDLDYLDLWTGGALGISGLGGLWI